MYLRAGALLLMLYRMYRRMPARQRRQLRNAAARRGYALARRHGPRLARTMRRTRRSRG